MNSHVYTSPLSYRYASEEMSYLFSPQYKYATWRRLWTALAKAQKTLGLPITSSHIRSLEAHIENIDFQKALSYEKIYNHDVVAHIHAYGDVCPEAKGIIHLGATSCFVTDNGDLIQMREALNLVHKKLIATQKALATFAKKYKSLPCLSYTHFQAAQPTTLGKRACLWLQDFSLDLELLETALQQFRFLGAKGATGTQASFLALFDGNHEKVKQLEALIAEEMGFPKLFPISGQTYSRKQDAHILFILSSIATSAHKCATDLRLLAHLKEVVEGRGKTQVGSSAMPHKRNPIHAERICSLARFLLSLNENPAYTAATQWLERTLDDSAGRRLYIPEAFLCADALLMLMNTLISELVVYPKKIQSHLEEELPFLATEQLLIAAVKKGKDRQEAHERLRIHAQKARDMMEEGKPCTLLEQIAQDPKIGLTHEEIAACMDIKQLVGRAEAQVDEYLGRG